MAETHMIVHLIYLSSTPSRFCAAFLHYLSRMISDIRRAYRHWSGYVVTPSYLDGGSRCITETMFNPLKCVFGRGVRSIVIRP